MSSRSLQEIVLLSLAEKKKHQNRELSSAFDREETYSSSSALRSLRKARKNIANPEDVFKASLCYYKNGAFKKFLFKKQEEEALRMLFLFFDVQSGKIREKDLDLYLQFLETRTKIRLLAEDPHRAIDYLESFYGDETDHFLIDITGSRDVTVKRWRAGSKPTRQSAQLIASSAEIFYQLHEIKGWKKKDCIFWFKENAREALLNSSYGVIFSPALEKRLRNLDLIPLGIDIR